MSGGTLQVHNSERRRADGKAIRLVTLEISIGDRQVVVTIDSGEFSKALANPGSFPAIAEFAEIIDWKPPPKRVG